MPLLAVLADDTTGAFEIASLAVGAGISTAISLDRPDAGTDAVVCDTQTRHVDPPGAAHRIQQLVHGLHSRWIYKKTDSTLRGPITAELEALQAARPTQPLVYVPAYPAMGRTTRHGILYVNGVPVSESEFRDDPDEPILDSSVLHLLPGSRAVDTDELEDALARGATRLVCDAETEGDLESIASTVVRVAPEALIAGPAGFARHWFPKLPLHRRPKPPYPPLGALLVVCGSLHPVSRAQAETAAAYGEIVLQTSNRPEADSLAILAEQVLRREANSIFVFGGDTLRTLLDALECVQLEPLNEILPGIPCAIAKLPRRRILLISKAGGFGGKDIVRQIRDSLEAE
ncbi:MAG TPA: four-carbon acid sugar kinase family protein [Bryobacteraceae bacterium]|nr:four-carbon acid sugar kinase family protein [Bryobacteraceae bacterium]